MLRVTDLRKRFGDVCAVDGLSLEVRRGEVFGLLGPNGAGKSTTIAMCIGLIHPDSGTVELQGLGDPRDPAVRAHLGLAPQSLAIYDDLSAEENMVFFGQLHGVPDPRGRALTLLERVGLAPRRQDRVKGFSGGMKRRLNIACGVLHRPQLILLDEPTVGVDPQSRQRIWEMLGKLRDEGASLLLTTHQLDEAQQLCERIVIIDHGKSIASGTVAELIASTIGVRHEIALRLDAPPPPELAVTGLRVDDRSLVGRIDNVAGELAPLLARIAASGRVVEDVQLASPTLHSVFIALTGRELRE